MKTRCSHLFIGFMLAITSMNAQANNTQNTALKDLAIIGSLASWWLSYQSGNNPFQQALLVNPDSHKVGYSHGYENKNQFNHFYYAKDLLNPLIEKPRWGLYGHWEAGIETWSSSNRNSAAADGYIFRLAPVMEYVYKTPDVQPYAELSIGINYLSNSTIENTNKSSQFHFVEYIGTGIKVRSFKIGYRFMHISNAGISLPNPASDVHKINISYQFNSN